MKGKIKADKLKFTENWGKFMRMKENKGKTKGNKGKQRTIKRK
jgi:hypothetical protein